MGYDDDPYRDEEGEPLIDYDELHDGVGGRSPEPHQDNFLDDDIDDWGGVAQERSPTPVFDTDKSGKPRKRLIKKGDARPVVDGTFSRREMYDGDITDDVVQDRDVGSTYGRGLADDDGGKKRKKLMKENWEARKKLSRPEKRYNGTSSSSSKPGSSSRPTVGQKNGYSGENYSGRDNGEVKEMWDIVAGGDSEDDQDGIRTIDDDNFIDDSGLDPADRYGSDNDRSPGHAPQAEEGEEDEEINQLFKMGKKKKRSEKSPAEIALLVEKVMAELEVTAEDDAELNRQGKPAVNKLKKLPLLTEVLSKKQLQQEFIDHGVLTLLKNWLEPLPDGSLPNINIRAAVLKILADFPIDLEQYDRREQLKKSGLGKVIMFLSKSDEETTSNRKLAKELVDKWSRPIFNKSTRFEDMRHIDEDQAFRRPAVRRPVNNTSGVESRDGDLDLDISRDRRPGASSVRLHTSRPEATPMDFVVRPQSKIDPDEIRARAKQVIQDQRRMKMNKKLQQLKAPKKRQLQATKLSVEGRGMLKYL